MIQDVAFLSGFEKISVKIVLRNQSQVRQAASNIAFPDQLAIYSSVENAG
jgi:hypothetical protein